MLAEPGKTVRIHYVGRRKDGEVFFDSRRRGPVEFQVGKQEVPRELDAAVVGMKVGETRTVDAPSEKAFGPRREDLVHVLPREEAPKDLKVKPGEVVTVEDDQGSIRRAVIREVSPEHIVVDANHPMSGVDLEYEVELLDIL